MKRVLQTIGLALALSGTQAEAKSKAPENRYAEVIETNGFLDTEQQIKNFWESTNFEQFELLYSALEDFCDSNKEDPHHHHYEALRLAYLSGAMTTALKTGSPRYKERALEYAESLEESAAYDVRAKVDQLLHSEDVDFKVNPKLYKDFLESKDLDTRNPDFSDQQSWVIKPKMTRIPCSGIEACQDPAKDYTWDLIQEINRRLFEYGEYKGPIPPGTYYARLDKMMYEIEAPLNSDPLDLATGEVMGPRLKTSRQVKLTTGDN